MGKPYFRAGVVAVIRRDDGKVMAFERSDRPGAWQLPQGGIDDGESPERAVWRELKEETGLGKKHVSLVGEHHDWTVYAWPKPMRKGERLGQAHRWFFFELKRPDTKPRPDGSEFSDYRWMSVGDLIDQVVDFRKGPYRQVLGG